MEFITARGWTDDQAQQRLEITSPRWAKISQRYDYLSSKEIDLNKLKTILAGDTVRGKI